MLLLLLLASQSKGRLIQMPNLTSNLKKGTSASSQTQGQVDGRIAATIVQAHLATWSKKKQHHLLRTPD